MAIIKQFDKRSGITYVYDSKSYYDKEKKCSRTKKTLIGKIDPDTDEMIPTDGRKNKSGIPKDKITLLTDKYISILDTLLNSTLYVDSRDPRPCYQGIKKGATTDLSAIAPRWQSA